MSAKKRKRDAKKQDKQNATGFALEDSSTAGQPACETEKHCEKLPWHKQPQWWQAWSNLVLVPVGIWALVIYSCQLDRMTDGINLTRQASKLDARAWVGLASINGTPVIGQPLIVKSSVRNSGKTYARKFKNIVTCQNMPADGTPVFFPDDWSSPGDSEGVIPPNSEAGNSYDVFKEDTIKVVTKERLEDWKSGNTILIVYGRTAYNDIFGCSHWTTYCSYLGTDLSYHMYKDRNQTDDNCGPEKSP